MCFALAASAVGLLITSAQAAPVIAERVVVTATVTESDARVLGRPITVVTREDIERFAGGSIVDALRLVPGVDVRARGERGVQTDFALRGAHFGQTLVLVDGLRLNNAQSGHHNGDLPVSAASIERIEIVTGASSSAHGADALGGTIHIVTRTDAHHALSAAAGSFGTTRADAAIGTRAVTSSAWGGRSSGFMFDRDWSTGGARAAWTPAAPTRLAAAHARKAFGANGFYGPSPSKEWTDLTFVSGSSGGFAAGWTFDARAAYRNHGDRFRWDIARPGFAENRHRTNAVDAHIRADRVSTGGARFAVGVSGGGDWIASSNLGNHALGRGAAFVELQAPLGGRMVIRPALRVDYYSTFGPAISPALTWSAWTDEGWRFRASAGRAFRVPTYTERFYRDPNHAALSELRPERGWTLDAGADWQRGTWTASGTAFRRWDSDVIDWVRASSGARWQTTNVHDVDTRGMEVSLTRHLGRGGFLRGTYAWIDTRAPALTLLSKYVLDYSRHAAGAHIAIPVAAGIDMSLRADRRLRSDGQRYLLVDARLSRPVGRITLFAEGANLLDETYREIAGVVMPGVSFMAGVALRR